jgi:hypothetical protein
MNHNSWDFDNPAFILKDKCWCGHKKEEHTLDENICIYEKFCNCKGFTI